MTASVSDVGADRVTDTELPDDFAGRHVLRDIGYMFRLFGRHIRRDPIIGSLLWAGILAWSIMGSYLGVRVALSIAATTNGMVAHDRTAVIYSLTLTTLFGLLSLVSGALGRVIDMTLRIRLRTVLTTRLLSGWLTRSGLYRPGEPEDIDFPEQRIQEDVYNFGLFGLDLLKAIVATASSLFLYSQQLWNLSKPMTIGATVEVPRAMFVAALASAIVITVATHLVGRNFTRLDVVRKRLEATFRHTMGQAREHAEQVALSGGQAMERERADHGYGLILRNWIPYTAYSAVLMAVQMMPLVTVTLPYWFLFDDVVAGRMTIGDLMIASAAFGAVFNSVATISTHYETFALVRSAALRIHLFECYLSRDRRSGLSWSQKGDGRIAAEHLEVHNASGQRLFALADLQLAPGERWLVRGRSGTGKSTLFRVLAGVWPFASGSVEVPVRRDAVMFLPQKPYLPSGTLAELLSYPRPRETYDAHAYRRVLNDVQLGALEDQIAVQRDWAKILSGGEQQRVALARALLHRPDFLFLDEATSSLDPVTEAEVFATIASQLPGTAIVTIAHGSRLARQHDHQLTIADGAARTGRPAHMTGDEA